MTLHLIRGTSERITDLEYDFRTEVWIFGDKQGFADLLDSLERARTAQSPTHVAAIPASSRGMRWVILPATTFNNSKPILRAVERIVFFNQEPTMQLVVCGNRRGYFVLADYTRRAMFSEGGPLDHWHCEDDDGPLLKRSVSLNFRGTISDWTQQELNGYYSDIQTGGKHRLPENISWMRPDKENSHDSFPSDSVPQLLFRDAPRPRISRQALRRVQRKTLSARNLCLHPRLSA